MVECGNGGPLASGRGWTTPKYIQDPGAEWVLQPMRDGEWWNVAESNAALSVTAIHRQAARRRPKGCALGGRPGDYSTGDQRLLP